MRKPGQLSEESINSKISSTLSWTEMARDLVIEIITKTSEEDKRLIIGNCSDVISDLSNAIESLRALLGLPPETINDEREEDD